MGQCTRHRRDDHVRLEGVFAVAAGGCSDCGSVERGAIAIADHYSVADCIFITGYRSSPGLTEPGTNNSICRSVGPVIAELRFRLRRSVLGSQRTHNRRWWAGRRAMHRPANLRLRTG